MNKKKNKKNKIKKLDTKFRGRTETTTIVLIKRFVNTGEGNRVPMSRCIKRGDVKLLHSIVFIKIINTRLGGEESQLPLY